MKYNRRTMLQGSLLGLLGVGTGRSKGEEGVPAAQMEATRDSPANCTAIEDELAALRTTKPYENASWGLHIVDLESGETVHARNQDRFFVPGSTGKLVSVSAAWDTLGSDYRFETPIYRTGDVIDGRLDGDLVLVGSGDLAMGGRTLPNGEIAYTSIDHTYANVIPGATLTEPDPLAGLNDLAAQVRDSGITRIDGDVIIDTRLFEDNDILDPETPLSPIIVNDNLIDVRVSPTEPGQGAEVTHRPETATYRVITDVTTVASDEQSGIEISSEQAGEILVSGQIAAADDPIVNVYQIDDPETFARTALIEALEAAGVEVTAPTVEPNPSDELLDFSYDSTTKVAEYVSPPFSEYAKLILKTSHNLGGNLMICLLAVEAGSTDCIDGFASVHDFLTEINVDTGEVSLSDGRGGTPEDHITPRTMTDILSYWHNTTEAEPFANALPILGVDGSLAETATDSPAAGHVFGKTGTVIGPDYVNDRLFLTAQTLAGYIDTVDGRRLAYSLFMNRAGIEDFDELIDVIDQVGELATVIQQNC